LERGGLLEPLWHVSRLHCFPRLCRCWHLLHVLLFQRILLRHEVFLRRVRSVQNLLLISNYGTRTHHFQRELVSSSEDFKEARLLKDTEVLGVERNIYYVFLSWQQSSLIWVSSEMCHFSEVEVEFELFVFILDTEIEVSPFVCGSLSELQHLSVNFDFRWNRVRQHPDSEGFVVERLLNIVFRAFLAFSIRSGCLESDDSS